MVPLALTAHGVNLVTSVADDDMSRAREAIFLHMKAVGKAYKGAVAAFSPPSHFSGLSAVRASEFDVLFFHPIRLPRCVVGP